MSKTAADIMDREFFYASPMDSVPTLLETMRQLGLRSAPVLDWAGRPRGRATIAEIANCRHMERLADLLTQPAVTMEQHAEIEAAAQMMAQHGTDSLVLTDESGVAVGTLSALDVLCALFGPSSSREESGVSWPPSTSHGWSPNRILDLEAIGHAPTEPGIILLSQGGEDSWGVWAEATSNIRERLDGMLGLPQNDPQLERLLEVYPRTIHFQFVVVHDPVQRGRLLRTVQNSKSLHQKPKPETAEPESRGAAASPTP
jgi:CBS domain-containing protein